MSKLWQKLALIPVILLVLYNSFYFRKLNEVKAAKVTFDARAYAEEFWSKQLLSAMDNAVELPALMKLLQNNPDQAFETHSHALGIGNIRYFPVQGVATVRSIDENEVVILMGAQPAGTELVLATEYIFGNAVRDATGLIDINEFTNSMDFNHVSAELNAIIRNRVLPPFRQNIKEGDQVRFAGAIELNQKYLDLSRIEIVPVHLSWDTPSQN